MRKHRWLTITFREALPVDSRFPLGAHYAPGSVWYYSPRDQAHVDFTADYWRSLDYNVTVGEVTR